VAVLVVVSACSDDSVKSPPVDTEAVRDFEAAWYAANTKYPLFDFKHIDWAQIHREYRPRAEATDDNGVYDLLDDFLGELMDAHVVYDHPLLGGVAPFTPPRVYKDIDAIGFDVIESYFTYGLRTGGQGKIRYGLTVDNVGYVHLLSLAQDGMMDDFHVVMNQVEAADGLILDLRGNLGGVGENVEVLIGRFIVNPTDGPDGYTVGGPIDLPPYEPDTTLFAYNNPMVILINGACASAPELVADLLGRMPHVTIVGDTTAGAGCWAVASAPGLVLLPSGRALSIPTTYFCREDGEPWEWNGIVPDVRIEQTRQNVLIGRDFQLEEAFDLLNR